MASVGVKSERCSDPSIIEDGDMVDIAQRILIKCENAKKDKICDEIGDVNSYNNDTRCGQNYSPGCIDSHPAHPASQHVVSVSGCSVTFKIEITGLLCEVNSEIVETSINISKAEAINWLRLLGYKQKNLLGFSNQYYESNELVNDSKGNNCTVDSTNLHTNPQTNLHMNLHTNLQSNMSETTEDMANLQQELEYALHELNNHNDEFDAVHNILIKQEPLFADENNANQKPSEGIGSDKEMLKEIKLEKEFNAENVSASEVINQLDESTVKYEPGESALTVESGMETLETEEQQVDLATAEIHGNKEAVEEIEPNRNMTGTKRHRSHNTKHKCNICALEYTSARGLDRHITVHYDNKSNIKCFKCILCSYRTVSAAAFDLHIRKHNNGGKLTCDHCCYTTARMCNFVRHIITHKKPQKHKYSISDKSSEDTSALKIHTRIHKPEQNLYKCSMSDSPSEDTNAVMPHARAHTTPRAHKCTLCPYEASQSHNLKRHLRIHSHERPYKCPLCPYAAAESRTLTRHIRTHSKERPYLCTLCPYTATQSGHLSQHTKRTHAKERHNKRIHAKELHNKGTYAKELHNKGTYAKELHNKRIHAKELHNKRAHANEPHYKCTLSPHVGTESVRRKTHLRSHTNKHPYKCGMCSYTASDSRCLKKHIILTHSKD